MAGFDEIIETVQGNLDESQERALALMEKLRVLEAEKSAMEVRLERAIRLKGFFPDAYKHGACSVYPRGNANRPDDMKFIIETVDGVKHVWKLLEVPVELWAQWKGRLRNQCSMMRCPKAWRD